MNNVLSEVRTWILLKVCTERDQGLGRLLLRSTDDTITSIIVIHDGARLLTRGENPIHYFDQIWSIFIMGDQALQYYIVLQSPNWIVLANSKGATKYGPYMKCRTLFERDPWPFIWGAALSKSNPEKYGGSPIPSFWSLVKTPHLTHRPSWQSRGAWFCLHGG